MLTTQLAIGFATAIDGRVPKIVDNLAIIKPTFMGAAPRIFEKAYGRIVGMTEAEGGAKLKIFKWAEGVGIEHSRAVRSGKSVSPILKAQFAVADKLVFSKVRERFGGRVRFFISGAAALSPDIAEWFHAAGVLILEGYGLTETSAGAFVNQPDNFKLGSVGTPFPGSEAKIAEDGEVLIKGPHIMQGYHNLDAESASSLTSDGWLHTGDEGRIDEDGFLFITGRKKELFKTSGGKYVAPPHIEGMFKGISALTSQIVVHGNERNFCSALITLDPDGVAEWAAHNGMAGKSYAEVVTSPEMHDVIQGQIDELNSKINRWETIKKFAILDHDLSSRERRDHAQHEGQAQRRRSQQQGHPRRLLRLGSEPSREPGRPAGRPGSRGRASDLRHLRPRAVLLGALRLLRLQHLHRRRAGRGCDAGVVRRHRDPRDRAGGPRARRRAPGRDGVLRRRHADAAAVG